MIVQNDSDYLRQLEIIRKIRDTITTKDEINLPQICVVGDQSAGKSSFLSRLTGVSFPTAAKMCTKAATVVTCNRDDALTQPRYEIEDLNNKGSYNAIASTAEAIQRAQDDLLKKAGVHNTDENSIITDQAIKLRVTGPDVIDIIIVDLPGIQHAGDTKDAIQGLIEANIEKPETLNLLVSEAKQDAELTKAIEIAAMYDPDKNRTLRVLSKFDNFDTPDTKNRAVRMIKDGVQAADGGGLNLGPHAVISIGNDGKLRTGKEGGKSEQKQLMEEYKLPKSRAGIEPLKARLQPLFANLIKQNLPSLKENVMLRLNETDLQLEKVGRKEKSPDEIIFQCHACLLEHIETFELDLTGNAFLTMKQQINESKEHITFDFATSGFEPNAFECILFQGKVTFDAKAKAISTLWHPIVNEYVKNAKENALESIHLLRSASSTKMYGPLISVIHAMYQDYLQKYVLPKFQDACLKCLDEERFFGTSNHYFDSKFLEDEICPPTLIDLFRKKSKRLLADDDKSPTSPSNYNYRKVSNDYLVECLEEAKQEIVHQTKHTDLVQNQKNRIFAAVKAHFDVEKKTFVDNLLKKTKDILIQGHKDFIEREFLRSKEILDAAAEDKYVQELRQDLIERLDRLKECMKLLRDVPLPPATGHGKVDNPKKRKRKD